MMAERSVVLIITCPVDSHADRAVVEIEARGYQVLRLHPEDFAEHGKVSLGLNPNDTVIKVGSRQARADEIISCWYRKPQAVKVPAMATEAETDFARKELAHMLYGFLRTLDCFWMSYLTHMQEASWKPLQLKVASSLGMAVPATYIGNDPLAARAFCASRPGGAVYKTLHSPMISEANICFTSIVRPEHLERIEKIAWSGGIFQALVAKAYDIRVIVIETGIYAFAIDSQVHETATVDWRHADPLLMRHETHCLPPALEQMILSYMRYFKLSYGAFDFVLTPDGDYVFLECNPGGQYGWLEAYTGVSLTARIVDSLLRQAAPL